jgi:4-diphosphocytidyl-2C-methyl-D-erythritol kinase
VSHNDTLHQYAPAKLNIYLEITKKKAKKVYEIYFSLILTTDYADMHGEFRDFRKDF